MVGPCQPGPGCVERCPSGTGPTSILLGLVGRVVPSTDPWDLLPPRSWEGAELWVVGSQAGGAYGDSFRYLLLWDITPKLSDFIYS